MKKIMQCTLHMVKLINNNNIFFYLAFSKKKYCLNLSTKLSVLSCQDLFSIRVYSSENANENQWSCLRAKNEAAAAFTL